MARYGDKYPSGISRAEVEKVRDKFLSDIGNAKFEGAVSDMPKFTSYMVPIKLFHLIFMGSFQENM